MFALAVSGIAFVCAIGAGLFGMWLGPRLPADHVSDDAKEIAKMVLAILGTLAALVLGLLIASAKSSLDSKIDQIKQAAARTVQLDRTLAGNAGDARPPAEDRRVAGSLDVAGPRCDGGNGRRVRQSRARNRIHPT